VDANEEMDKLIKEIQERSIYGAKKFGSVRFMKRMMEMMPPPDGPEPEHMKRFRDGTTLKELEELSKTIDC